MRYGSRPFWSSLVELRGLLTSLIQTISMIMKRSNATHGTTFQPTLSSTTQSIRLEFQPLYIRPPQFWIAEKRMEAEWAIVATPADSEVASTNIPASPRTDSSRLVGSTIMLPMPVLFLLYKEWQNPPDMLPAGLSHRPTTRATLATLHHYHNIHLMDCLRVPGPGLYMLNMTQALSPSL